MVSGSPSVKVFLDSAFISFAVTGTPGQYQLNLPQTISLCDDEVILDAGYYSNINYLWNTGETTPQINALESGKYIVKIFEGNCEVNSDTSIVISGCELYFPNSFTPNGDGINDVFAAKGIDIKKFEITIYNRWGEKVSSSTSIDRCWDGKFGNGDAPQGVYIWQTSYITTDNGSQRINKIGHVNLLR